MRCSAWFGVFLLGELGEYTKIGLHARLYFIGRVELPAETDDAHVLVQCQPAHVNPGGGTDKNLDFDAPIGDVKRIAKGQIVAHRLAEDTFDDNETTFGCFIDAACVHSFQRNRSASPCMLHPAWARRY